MLIGDKGAEMYDNKTTETSLYDDMVRYARNVAEHFPGDCEQIELHLESEFPEGAPTEIMYAALEAIGG